MYDELTELWEVLKKESRARFYEKFLALTGYKIGDKVNCEFDYEISSNHGCRSWREVLPGVLKQEDGILFIESVQELPGASFVNKGRKGYWNYFMEKKKVDVLNAVLLRKIRD